VTERGKRFISAKAAQEGQGPMSCTQEVLMGLSLDDQSAYLFNEGRNFNAYRDLGCHLDHSGARFAVWAPRAALVSVAGDFNGWNTYANPMQRKGSTGIWETHIGDVVAGDLYKYVVEDAKGTVVYKSDPFGFFMQRPPDTASAAWTLGGYTWGDGEWMAYRDMQQPYDKPLNIYEVHSGSWKRNTDGSIPNWRDLAKDLVPYAKNAGFTHIELLPVQEYPFDPSWGYQSTGYYCVTSRHGIPQDFMHFIDQCHQNGLGVILDWPAAHFPKDESGLFHFDGTEAFEPKDPKLAYHPHWGTCTFDFGKNEVQSFLISNACFWFDVYHADGLRVDAVSSMLYRDYGRKRGEWNPNRNGSNENLEAVDFLRKLNTEIFARWPNALMIAEESTAWAMVSWPADKGGLGFNFKWNMGWMNDILEYMKTHPADRPACHDRLLFSMWYAFSENFILALSHDEVVHGKKSLLDKMPGDYWQKFAQLRLLLGYMYAHPGKKLLFMGGELGQFIEWRFDAGLDWHLLEYPAHQGMSAFFSRLSHFYKQNRALYEQDGSWAGFQWLNTEDKQNSVVCFARFAKVEGKKKPGFIVCIFNFTPTVHHGYRLGVPESGYYSELLNSDSGEFFGSGTTNAEKIVSEEIPCHGFEESIQLTIAPYAAQYLAWEGRAKRTDQGTDPAQQDTTQHDQG
jgi:1,4-alpha-glucan branching enzyme